MLNIKIEKNNAIDTNPEVVNKDPYNEGWLIKIEMTNPADVNELLDASAYKALLGH